MKLTPISGAGSAGNPWTPGERAESRSPSATQESLAGTSLAGSKHARPDSNSASPVASDQHRDRRLRTDPAADVSRPRHNETARFLGNSARTQAGRGRPTIEKTYERIQGHIHAAGELLQARSALLNKLHELHGGDPKTEFRRDDVTDLIVNADPRYCHLVGLRIGDNLSLATLALPVESADLATGYFDKLKGVQEVEKSLRKHPYGKAARDTMNARLAELSAHPEAGANPARMQEHAALAAILENLGPDGRPRA